MINTIAIIDNIDPIKKKPNEKIPINAVNTMIYIFILFIVNIDPIKANIENIIVDTAVLDLPSISINFETTGLIKRELGLPTGFAPANAIYGWNFIKKYGDVARCGAIASIMTYCASAPSDFILFGPIKFAKCVIPAISLISGVNSYYQKRVKRNKISDRSPLHEIF